jgi:FemAB family protein
MLEIKEVKALIQSSQLDAELRADCANEWNDLVDQVSDVPTYYLEHLVNYQSAVFQFLSDRLIDISLVLYNDKKVCGVWPLFLDLNNTEPVKSINDQFGGIVVPPLFVENFPKKSERRIVKSCIRFVSSLVKLTGSSVWRTSELSGSRHVSQWHQIALENDAYPDRVNYELYVDLTLSIEEIRKAIRKSYKPLVSSGLKNWEVTVLDQYCEKTWNRFRELHKHVSGGITRPIESWNIQHNAIKCGNAFLVYVSGRDGEMVGGGLFDMSGNEGNYSVATYKKSLSDQPLGHLVQYHALLKLKEKGRSRYYIGTRFYREDLPGVTEKQVNISSFKAGFSTFLSPRVTLKSNIYEEG